MTTIILILQFLLAAVLPSFLIWWLWRRYLKKYFINALASEEDKDNKNPYEKK